MVCKKCGSLVEDGLSACPDCGANPNEPLKILLADDDTDKIPVPDSKPAENTADVKKERREFSEKEKKRIKTLSFALAGIAVIVIIFASVYGSTANKIIRNFESGEYEAAYSVYNEKYASEEKTSSSLVRKLENYMSELKSAFEASEILYSDVNEALNIIKDMRIDKLSETINETSEYINSINMSRQAYTEAKKHHSTGDYRAAIISYKQVVSEDTNYQDAVASLTEIIELYRAQVVESASALADEGDIFAAIDALRYALEVLKNDKQLKSALDAYIYGQYEEVRTAALEKAAEFVDEKNYPSAIAKVKELLDGNEDDEILIEVYNGYLEDYKNYALNEAGALYGADKVFEALDLLDEALRVLENNAELTAKRVSIEENMPVDLLTFTPVDSQGWKPNSGSLKDSKGEQHEPRLSYIVTADAQATYALHGIYRKIEGQIVPHRDFAGDIVGQITIHADNKLVYSSPAIIKSTNKFGFSLELDGVQEITISVSGSSDEKNISLILMDIILFE